MRTVFVTGAEGFCGRHVLKKLADSGYDVVAGVRNRARKLAYERQGTKALVCDVADAINVARLIASVRPDAVLHLAGPSSPASASDEPLEAYQSIVTAWANVLDAVRRSVPRAKIVLTSSCEVYALDTAEPLAETSPAEPTSTFGSLKYAAEAIAHTFFRDYHLNITIARPFHALGPGLPESSFWGAVARRFAEWPETAERSELWLPHLQGRWDLLHVDDVAAAYERLLVDGRPNETYNVCSGNGVSCAEIASQMSSAAGVTAELLELPQDGEEAPRLDASGDNSKICSELHWKSTRDWRDGANELVMSVRSAARRKPVTA